MNYIDFIDGPIPDMTDDLVLDQISDMSATLSSPFADADWLMKKLIGAGFLVRALIKEIRQERRSTKEIKSGSVVVRSRPGAWMASGRIQDSYWLEFDSGRVIVLDKVAARMIAQELSEWSES